MAGPARTRTRRRKQQIAEAHAVAHAIGHSARVIVGLRASVWRLRVALALVAAIAVLEAVPLGFLAFLWMQTP